ncbi:hypothetical protein BV20DRAFT_981445 [Pilatotrama ljubarskyi]|nr:hypothetical protein BV20DRAFT_981445 [Pilatotrama ljubarskyi]
MPVSARKWPYASNGTHSGHNNHQFCGSQYGYKERIKPPQFNAWSEPNTANRPLTRSRMAIEIAKRLKEHLEIIPVKHNGKSISFDQLVLVSAHLKSKGTFQPIIGVLPKSAGRTSERDSRERLASACDLSTEDPLTRRGDSECQIAILYPFGTSGTASGSDHELWPLCAHRLQPLRRLLLDPPKGEIGRWFEKVQAGDVPLMVEVESADIMATLISLKSEVEHTLGTRRLKFTT